MQRYENHWHELVKEDTGRFVLYSEAIEEIDTLKKKMEQLKTMSTVEMMCENENVKHHITEWENRCLKAEMIPVNTKTVGKP